jgi:GlpG protein
VEQNREGWAIWVENDDHLEAARGELAAFERNPDDAKYHQAGSRAAGIRAEQEKKAQRRRRNFIDVRTHGMAGGQGAYPLTVILITLSMLVAFVTRLGKDPVTSSYFTIAPVAGLSYEQIQEAGLSAIGHGQVWRLITPIFLHLNLLHILFNMLWLADLGAMIERRRGSWRLLVLVLVSGIVSNLAQYGMSGPNFGGMSGVVYALFGCAWMKGRYQPQEGVGVFDTTVYVMLVWMAAGFVLPMGMANSAHAVGLAMGMVFGAGPHFWERLRRGMR